MNRINTPTSGAQDKNVPDVIAQLMSKAIENGNDVSIIECDFKDLPTAMVEMLTSMSRVKGVELDDILPSFFVSPHYKPMLSAFATTNNVNTVRDLTQSALIFSGLIISKLLEWEAAHSKDSLSKLLASFVSWMKTPGWSLTCRCTMCCAFYCYLKVNEQESKEDKDKVFEAVVDEIVALTGFSPDQDLSVPPPNME